MAIKLPDFANALQKAIEKAVSPDAMRSYALEAANMIRVRTRLGYGVASSGGKRERLKPLSESYKKQRAGQLGFFTTESGAVVPYKPKRKPKISEFTTPGRSNLTFTGQLLDSLQVTSANRGKATIGVQGRRAGSSLTNRDVARFVEEQGRPFLNLSDVEIKRVNELVTKRLTEELRKLGFDIR